MLLSLNIILRALGSPESGHAVPITGVVIDSREAYSGALFVARPGERVDGHDFVADAFQRGAVAALVQRDVELPPPASRLDLRDAVSPASLAELRLPAVLRVADSLAALQSLARHWRAAHTPRVIGVTGSVGKTTTKEVTAAVLATRYRTLKSEGNLNNEIGLPLTLLKLTPAHQRAVLEMGLYTAGEIALLCDIARPHVGIVTNVGPVHLERAGSLKAIARGKAELVQALPPAPEGVAILNYDDPWVRPMAEMTKARVFTYGLDPAADLWASEIAGLGLDGVHFQLHAANETLHVRVPMLGRHSVHTALRAAAVGVVEGLTWEEIIEGLQSGRAQLRLVVVPGPEGSLILDDTYNASPESVIADLNLLADLEGRKVAVLGDMLELGDFEEQGHRLVGARAGEVTDLLVAVGDRAGWIAEEAQAAGLAPERISRVSNSEEALLTLRQRIGAGDVVLVKGSRGLRMDRIVAALEVRHE